MKRLTYLFIALIALLITSAAAISAQSTDRDNPTPLNSSEVSGSFGDHQEDGNKEIFYSFTAGPGELTITFDVKRRNRDDGAGVSFELLPRSGSSTALLCCEGVQSGDGGTGREVASVKLTKRQMVILHITNGSNGGCTFDVRLSGAASFGGSTVGGYNDNNDNDRGRGDIGNVQGRGNRGGEQVDVPSSGILHIRMKNGTSQDIVLSRVRNITIRQ
jgi:hypothetical protein